MSSLTLDPTVWVAYERRRATSNAWALRAYGKGSLVPGCPRFAGCPTHSRCSNVWESRFVNLSGVHQKWDWQSLRCRDLGTFSTIPISRTRAPLRHSQDSLWAGASQSSFHVAYLYDGDGDKVKDSGGASGTRIYVHDLQGNVLEELAQNGVVLNEYVYLGTTRIARVHAFSQPSMPDAQQTRLSSA